jgi:hypothetical protein
MICSWIEKFAAVPEDLDEESLLGDEIRTSLMSSEGVAVTGDWWCRLEKSSQDIMDDEAAQLMINGV